MGTVGTSSNTDIKMQEPLSQQSNLRANPPWLISGNVPKTQEPVQQETNRRINPPWLNSDTGFKNYPKKDSSRKRRRVLDKQARPRLANLASSNVEAFNILSQPDGSKYSLRRGKIVNSITENVSTSDNMKGYNKDIHGGGHDDVRILGGRILPSYMTSGMPAASSSSSLSAASGDRMNHSGSGEDKHPGKDERLIYQAALEDLYQPKTEVTPSDGLLSVPLLRHQKIALAWMLRKETKSLHCLGGILADDQGLGKTVSMIALILMQKALQTKSIPANFMNQNAEALDIDGDEIDGDVKLEGNDDVKKLKSKCLSHQESTAVNSGEEYDENDTSGLDKVKSSDVGASTCVFSRKRLEAGTLVVCPASLLWQWARELDDKVADESKLSVLVYHGGTRTKDPSELAHYDVVLTTYTIITNEVPKDALVNEDDTAERNMEDGTLSSSTFASSKKRKNASQKSKKKSRKRHHDNSSSDYECGPLARVRWFRVILDEAQTIKNHRTRVARACFNLQAKIKWCLSGTPMQNTVDDLYSYFRFIKYDPYSSYKSFIDIIKVPTSRNPLHGYKKLQAVLRTIMLRRTKGTLLDGEPVIKLPTKSVHLSKIEFSSEERAFYRQLEAASRAQFKVYAAAGTVKQNYGNILLMLLRLRQACDHPHLVKGYKSDPVREVSKQTFKKLRMEACVNLLNRLESSLAICCLCSDPPENLVVTSCGHVFCYECVSEYITGDDSMCPAPDCKQQIGHDVVFSESTLRGFISNEMVSGSTQEKCIDESTVVSGECSSSKIRAILEILQLHSKPPIPDSDPDDITDLKHTADSSVGGKTKTIVFSQWTGMLDLVEISLNEKFIEYRRLDGRMSLSARDQAVKDFSNDPEVTVMLMSLKAGNLGLNMVAATHVVLLDLWWNPTTEDQAVDRAHRIGQTRPVTVTRITIKDTVEDRILALQEEKRKMVASAFGEDQAGSSAARLTEDDLKRLFMV